MLVIKGEEMIMKNLRRVVVLLIVASMVVSLVACAGTPGSKAGAKKKIAFSVFTMEWEFFQMMEAGARKAIEDMGYEYILHDQKGDQTEMVSGCQNLINQDIAALVVSPCQPDPLPAIVEEAHAKGIPVVICDIGTGGSFHDGIVISDNYGGGQNLGKAIIEEAEKLGLKKEYVSVRALPQYVYAQRRSDGQEDVLDEAGWTKLAEYNVYADTEQGYKIMQDILVAFPDVKVVLGYADSASVGMGQAAMDAGKTGILITGADGTEQAVNAIKAGTMFATMQQFSYDMGAKAAEVASNHINKKTVTYDNKGTKEIYADVLVVDKSNCDDLAISITGIKWDDIK